jgi:hypothetical protein
MSIDRDPELGYRVHAPGHGLHLVSADGARVAASLPDGPAWRYQLLLFAQILPLAATLRGVELLHASAVAFDGRVAGFVAASGTGKSSVAAQLVGRGGSFFTDDALAMDRTDDAVVAHAGPRFANVHAHELDSLPAAGRERLGAEVGRSEKVHLEPPPVDEPLELVALYFLSRHGAEPLRIDALEDEARALLASTFVMHVQTPERLMTHLDVCSDIARRVPCLSVHAPQDARAAQVADSILEHFGGLG